MQYKRVLLKLSGEALKDEESSSIFSPEKLKEIASAIKALKNEGCQVCIVVGAGNIWRGKLASSIGIEPAKADYMGMLGTVINAEAISSTLNQMGIPNNVMTSLEMKAVAETYYYDKAWAYLEKGKVVIFGGGTGNPFFTTDTCAALRAKEMKCDAIFMAKNGVEGVFTADPRTDKEATLIKKITYTEVLNKNLKVMDSTAVSLLRESNIIIRVFDMGKAENFAKVMNGED